MAIYFFFFLHSSSLVFKRRKKRKQFSVIFFANLSWQVFPGDLEHLPHLCQWWPFPEEGEEPLYPRGLRRETPDVSSPGEWSWGATPGTALSGPCHHCLVSFAECQPTPNHSGFSDMCCLKSMEDDNSMLHSSGSHHQVKRSCILFM